MFLAIENRIISDNGFLYKVCETHDQAESEVKALNKKYYSASLRCHNLCSMSARQACKVANIGYKRFLRLSKTNPSHFDLICLGIKKLQEIRKKQKKPEISQRKKREK